MDVILNPYKSTKGEIKVLIKKKLANEKNANGVSLSEAIDSKEYIFFGRVTGKGILIYWKKV